MNFQKYVIVFFAILLVIILIFLGVNINKPSSASWPPVVSYCPDYWTDTPNADAGANYVHGSNCIAGKINNGPIDPNTALNFTVNPTDATSSLAGYDSSFQIAPASTDATTGVVTPATYYTFTGPKGNCGLAAWANHDTSKPIAWNGITYGNNFQC